MSLAATSGDIIALRGFLGYRDNCTSFNCIDFHGMTPLHAAIRSKQVLCVEWLLKHGANVHQRDSHEFSPLLLAVTLLHKENQVHLDEIIRLLRVTGAALGSLDSAAKKVFFDSIISGSFFILEKMIEFGFNPALVKDSHHRRAADYLPLCPEPNRLKKLLSYPKS
jgi:hypothetical protein